MGDKGEAKLRRDRALSDIPRRWLARPARGAVAAIVDGAGALVDGAEAVAGRAERTWQERPGARVRRVRRMGAQPLRYLVDVHPNARNARPVQVGLRSIDVSDICGTAVGGGAQRGGDFLPLKPFRGKNWVGRWQRLRSASDRLETLPPIDVVKFGDCYWVADGHNRVGLALYSGQVAIDASIVELVPSGARRTEPIVSLAPSAAESRSLRTAGSGMPTSEDLVRDEPNTTGPERAEKGGEAPR